MLCSDNIYRLTVNTQYFYSILFLDKENALKKLIIWNMKNYNSKIFYFGKN